MDGAADVDITTAGAITGGIITGTSGEGCGRAVAQDGLSASAFAHSSYGGQVAKPIARIAEA